MLMRRLARSASSQAQRHLRADVAVVGGGVVGLAVARAVALSGTSVVLLEAESELGTHTSSRNSEGASPPCRRVLRTQDTDGDATPSNAVIHAGLYYTQGSLKARLSVAGKAQLYDYCAARGVPCSRLGKLVIAPGHHQSDDLSALAARAAANGVDDLQPLTPAQVAALEPHVRAEGGGLLSPSSGVLDVRRLMASFAADALASGRATLLKNARVVAGELHQASSWRLTCGDGITVACDVVVNCGGLQAQEVSGLLGVAREDIPRLFYARGCYFSWTPATPLPFCRLVYPLPPAHGAGLGVHATLDVTRTSLRFGPDVAFIDALSYDGVDVAALEPAFEDAIRDYFPALPKAALQFAYAGVRPKLAGPGQLAADFKVSSHEGKPGLLALYGIESPGLTACMALADTVVARLQTC